MTFWREGKYKKLVLAVQNGQIKVEPWSSNCHTSPVSLDSLFLIFLVLLHFLSC